MIISEIIARELNIKLSQVTAAIQLLDAGATVPFISRYRKEATGGLDDTQLRLLEERVCYLRELEERRQTIIASIREQNQLTDSLLDKIQQATHKATLEDLYLPYKPKRRTKAQVAKEAGLQTLALALLNDPRQTPLQLASTFIHVEKNILTAADALLGARHILMELFCENAALLGDCRHFLWQHGVLTSHVIEGKETEGAKFRDYFAYQEAIRKIPSHRTLALLRGQKEGFLRLKLTLTESETIRCLEKITTTHEIKQHNRPADHWLMETVQWTWNIKLLFKLELELVQQLREQAEEEAIRVFANNLKHLLMAAPAGSYITMGLDPGLRTGVKAVIIDETGKLLSYTTIYPHAPQRDWDNALTTLATLCETHQVKLISIGNGTASRETHQLVLALKKRYPHLAFNSIVVSEAGASVYSASALAAQEFPTLDVTYRGAVSIARRLQDPLSELVKIDPKAIGVGQYQHDVNQTKLSHRLHTVMEDCVNAVGVNINTASAALLGCVAGLNKSIADHIIQFRNTHGAFQNRKQLKSVPRLGEKSFEQAAGFLRIHDGDNPLDASAVHPEAYLLVEKILHKQQKSMKELMGNTALLATLNPAEYADAQFGVPTVKDILRELEKPGRDPRPAFHMAAFQEGIETLNDLRKDMILEGTVTNVANFGAFVDIGVHQDGLIHISLLADHFVKDPHSVIKVGDIVKVRVIEIDLTRKRIQLQKC
ncbi:MAG TPA: Tex family protein [Gammaproteobacteria bacterium]|jgi:uncharacterized protein|nr:Tex family protein [Gammaproteobacteria bacterium]